MDTALVKARLLTFIKLHEEVKEEIAHLQSMSESGPLFNQTFTFEDKWIEIRDFLLCILQNHFKYINPTIPSLKDCKVTLRVDRTGQETQYTWEFVLPKEKIGGDHWTIIPLTDRQIFFSSRRQNRSFIDYLVDH
ncbi:MAG: hypothetical protein AABY22_23140, partial [Nanoarchaeota archaeon]